MHLLDGQSLVDHLDALYRVAFSICRSPDDAADLVQETCARILARPRMVRGDDRVYLMRALRNTHLKQVRARGSRPATVALEAHDAVQAREAWQPDQAVAMSDVYAAIRTLPGDFRLALAAVDLLGLSYDEAARALEIDRTTLATRVHRARKRVIETLEPLQDEASGAQRLGPLAVSREP